MSLTFGQFSGRLKTEIYIRSATTHQCSRHNVYCKTAWTANSVTEVNLRDLLHYHQPARTLRSSSQLLLYQPVTRINFQSKAFSIMAPAVWNSLSATFKLNCSLLHTARSNISSAADASDSNSQHTAPPINVFDIWHLTKSVKKSTYNTVMPRSRHGTNSSSLNICTHMIIIESQSNRFHYTYGKYFECVSSFLTAHQHIRGHSVP